MQGREHPLRMLPRLFGYPLLFSCTCWWNSGFPPAFPISGSVQMTPRFPPAGPDGHGSPPSTVLSGRYDFLPPLVLRLIVFLPAGSAGCCLPGFVSARGRSRRRAGDGDGPGSGSHAGHPSPASCPRARAGPPRFPGDPSRDSAPVHEAYSAASSPDVYASRRALPHAVQDSLPAGGLRLCRAGVEPAGPLRKVSAHGILLSRTSPSAIAVRWYGGIVRPAPTLPMCTLSKRKRLVK